MTRQPLSKSQKLSYYYDEAASGGIQVVLKPFTYFPVLANMQRQLHPEGGETKRLRGSDLGRDHKDFAASSRSFCYGDSTQDRHHDAHHVDRVATLQKRSSSGGGGGGVGGSQWSNDSRASPRYGSSAVSSNSVPSEGYETNRSRRNDLFSSLAAAIKSGTGGAMSSRCFDRQRSDCGRNSSDKHLRKHYDDHGDGDRSASLLSRAGQGCYGGSTQDRDHDARHVDREATSQKRSSSGGGGGVGGSQWSNDSRASPRYGSSAVSSNSVPSEGNETKRSTKPLPQYCRRNDALSADMVATTQIRSSTGGGGGGVSGGGAFSAVQTAPVQATKKKRKNRGKNYAGGSDDDDDDDDKFEDYYPGSHGGGSTGVGGVGGSNSGGGSD